PALPDHPGGTGDGGRSHALPAATAKRLIGSVGSWVVYPVLFAVYPVLALFARNAREVKTIELAAILGWAILGSLGTWLLFALLLRDGRRAGLVTALAVLLFFTFDLVLGPMEQLRARLGQLWVRGWGSTTDPLWVIVPELILLGGFAFGVVP